MMWVLLIFLAVSLYQEWKTVCIYAFLLERYYGQKESKRLHLLKCKRKMRYIRCTKFRRGYKHSIIVRGKYKEHYIG